MIPLTAYEEKIHRQAIRRSAEYITKEGELIESLCEVERLRFFRKLGKKNFLKYIVDELQISDSVAYVFQNVTRRALKFPALKKALVSSRLSLWTAARFLSILNVQNQEEIVEFACANTVANLNREVAKRNPRAAKPDRVKMIAEDLHELRVAITDKQVEKLKRVQSCQAQRRSDYTLMGSLDAVLDAYLNKYDAVRKAERAAKRKSVKKFCTNITSPPAGRELTAADKHPVNLRDGGRCTCIGRDGKRCNEDRWTEIHHIVPRSQGGGNELENLTTLCWSCHDLIHQMEFPLNADFCTT